MKCLHIFCIAALCSVFLIPLGPFTSQAYEDTQCFICHTSAKKLIEITREIAKTRPAVTSAETEGEGWGGAVEPLAPHEKIFVDSEIVDDENHGLIACHECHGGNPDDPNWKTAHEDVVKDPTYPDATAACGDCHDEITEHYTKSLHVSLRPYKVIIGTRANPEGVIPDKLLKGMENHCFTCHSSCGQCHISRPNSVEGGLLNRHLFVGEPPMEEVCAACHGSRVKKEYFGEKDGLQPSVHQEMEMKCADCHTAEEMHGDDNEYAHRFEVENGPKCLDCHEEIYDRDADNVITHRIHKDEVSCHVCHAQPYNNCSVCHVGTDTKGLTFYKTKASWFGFKIGLNPLKSEKRTQRFVPLRHVPVDRKTFAFYVKGGLSDFDAVPTWKLATPHNIRLKTPQNASCNSCHGNKPLFLLEKDVEEAERGANKGVVVPADMIPREQKWQPK
ncbi:MAG: cytochrome c3 family protein [Deltaproteobacteria bacterium]|nr:MAG: cytochrome c3 family protein [Deltaproteobacteria bacterium]